MCYERPLRRRGQDRWPRPPHRTLPHSKQTARYHIQRLKPSGPEKTLAHEAAYNLRSFDSILYTSRGSGSTRTQSSAPFGPAAHPYRSQRHFPGALHAKGKGADAEYHQLQESLRYIWSNTIPPHFLRSSWAPIYLGSQDSEVFPEV